ncbi:MAG TPA: terminase small subunit [Stellaceae bacterium]|nr:terminase small subunit [Stellaceae bacterium]
MNERERRFVAEYLVDCSASAAAQRAGYGGKYVKQNASALLRRHDIAAAVAKAEAERAESRRVTSDRILSEYARIAFADMRDFVDWGPDRFELRDRNLLSDWQGGAVARVDPPGNGKPGRVRLHDKHAALEFLARHTGLLGQRGPQDDRHANRDARTVLVERLKRLARGETEPPKS